ncbi:MAG: hypothetical protein NVS4B3_18420 [Gemmatimonadaceae bacterium]
MRRTLVRAAFTGFLSAFIAFAGAAGYVGQRSAFGSTNLAVFGSWCALLGLMVAIVSTVLIRAGLPSRRATRGLYGIGVGFVVAVALTLAMWLGLGPWMWAFGFPVPYLFAASASAGVGLAFATAQPAASPRLGLPLLRALAMCGGLLTLVAITPLGLTFGSMYIWDRAEPEVHLLPAGFRGPVVIIYGQPNGDPPRREGRVRLYIIPPSGVLRTQAAPNRGWSKPSYFYVDAAGRRSPIVRGLCDDPLSDGPMQACTMGVIDIDNLPRPEYSAYVVTRQVDLRAQTERGDSLVRAEVFGHASGSPRPD